MPWEMLTMTTDQWRWKRAGWWWYTRMIGNTKSRTKLVPQVRCNMPKRADCDPETGVNRWLEESDQCRWLSGTRRLYCDEITQTTWRRILTELIILCGENNFLFNAFVYRDPVHGSENTAGLEDLGTATTARVRAFWMCWRRFNCDLGT